LSIFCLRFVERENLVAQREFEAVDARVARFIASATCYATETACDAVELWEGTQRIEWHPPRKNALAITEGRQQEIIEKEIALANSAWALANARRILHAEDQPKHASASSTMVRNRH
jgi:hypothetical protein